MIKLVIENTHTSILGQFHPDFQMAQSYHEALRKELGYKVQGADWSPHYKEGHWDGIISLYRKPHRDRPVPQFPTGLIRRVITLLKVLGVKYSVEDAREKPKRDYPLETAFAENGRELRFYQKAAADKALEAGRGILALATGGGKTICACEILSRAGCGPFLFYVPSLSLLKQTHKEFSKYLRFGGKPVKIGMAGGGVSDLNPVGINVVTYQTVLAAYDQKYQERGNKVVDDPNAGESSRKTLDQLESEFRFVVHALNAAHKTAQNSPVKEGQSSAQRTRSVNAAISKQKKAHDKAKSALDGRRQSMKRKEALRAVVGAAKGFIVDEAHIAAVVIEALGEHAPNAYYRWGLTATAWREDNQEIRMEGAMGRKLIEISASDLTELGFLVPARIFMIRIAHNEPTDDYHDVYDKHIKRCWERNFRIKQVAEEFFAAGRPTLILVEQVEHGRILETMIKDAIFVAGSDKGEDCLEDEPDTEKDYRRRILNDCEAGKTILIATSWAYTGVDAPAISTLILAGTNKSAVTVYQQVGRVLRPLGKDVAQSQINGKSEAVIVDFMDAQKDLHQHSYRRKRVYQNERAWTIKMIK